MTDYSGILHASVLVSDTARALAFYRGVLGMKLAERPAAMSFPGAWLQVGEQQIHLIESPDADAADGRPQLGGLDRHVALGVGDLEAVRSRLEGARVPWTMSRSGRRALFCRDPDGNTLEIAQPDPG
jgi:glyoxylase I family protein